MKHQCQGRTFGRKRNARRALLKTLLGSLIIREKMTTTEARAKEVKMKVDRLINIAKGTTDEMKKVASLRLLAQRLPKVAVEKVTKSDFLSRFESRNSGYVRIAKLGQRKSDSAKMAVIEFV